MATVRTVPKTPTCLEEFDAEWLQFILESWLSRTSDKKTNHVSIKDFTASVNGLQGQLSTTYVIDVKYAVQDSEEEEEEKSIFVKVSIVRGTD